MSHTITGNQLVRVIATLQFTQVSIDSTINSINSKIQSGGTKPSPHVDSSNHVTVVQLQRKRKEIQELINELTIIINT